jgi:hypothetical protein
MAQLRRSARRPRVLLAEVNWAVDKTHHIWGSAVMVAPGVALTARHVFEDILAAGLSRGDNGYLPTLGFHDDGMDIWSVDSLTSFHSGSDLAVLTIVRATVGGVDPSREIVVNPATIATCGGTGPLGWDYWLGWS